MSRNEAGLNKAKTAIQELRHEFWENVLVPGSPKDFKTVIDLVKTGVKYQQEIIDNNYKEIKELYHRLPYDPEHNELGYREDGDTKRNQ